MQIPGLDLPNWLEEITPEGALALSMAAEGMYVFAPFPLPLTELKDPGAREGASWVESKLARLQLEKRGGRQIDDDARKQIARILNGPQRPDGRPGWHPDEARRRTAALAWAYTAEITDADRERARQAMAEANSNTGVIVPTKGFRRGDRGIMRGIHLAVSQDIGGASPAELSGMARLRDHERFNEADAGQPVEGDHRSLRRLISPAREILWHLGAWPWTHAPAGRLPADWRTSEAFTAPLAAWHSASLAEARGRLDRNELVFNWNESQEETGGSTAAEGT